MLRKNAVLALAAILMTAGTLPAEPAATQASAKDVAQKVITDILGVLRDKNLSKSQRSEKVRAIASEHMDFQTLARISLGAPWRKLTEDQKTRFSDEFRKHVINTYRHTTDDYTDEDIRITAEHPESDGDATILTTVIGTKDSGQRGEVAKVDYRLRKSKEGVWKIIDVTIDGVSLVANFRAQFKDIVAQGNIEKLISLLHDKNARAEQNAPSK